MSRFESKQEKSRVKKYNCEEMEKIEHMAECC